MVSAAGNQNSKVYLKMRHVEEQEHILTHINQ